MDLRPFATNRKGVCFALYNWILQQQPAHICTPQVAAAMPLHLQRGRCDRSTRCGLRNGPGWRRKFPTRRFLCERAHAGLQFVSLLDAFFQKSRGEFEYLIHCNMSLATESTVTQPPIHPPFYNLTSKWCLPYECSSYKSTFPTCEITTLSITPRHVGLTILFQTFFLSFYVILQHFSYCCCVLSCLAFLFPISLLHRLSASAHEACSTI